jgi:hypothetical protein
VLTSTCSDKQKRRAAHIEEGNEDCGVSQKDAERRTWAKVKRESGGGNKSGFDRGKAENIHRSRDGDTKAVSAKAFSTGLVRRRRLGNKETERQ